jgi:hypothetical protein
MMSSRTDATPEVMNGRCTEKLIEAERAKKAESPLHRKTGFQQDIELASVAHNNISVVCGPSCARAIVEVLITLYYMSRRQGEYSICIREQPPRKP